MCVFLYRKNGPIVNLKYICNNQIVHVIYGSSNAIVKDTPVVSALAIFTD